MTKPFLLTPLSPIRPLKRARALALLSLTVILLSSCSELQSLRLIKEDQARRIEALQTELENISDQNIDTLSKQNDTIKYLNANNETLRAELVKAQTQRTQNERDLEKTTHEAILKLEENTRELQRLKELEQIQTTEIETKTTQNHNLQTAIDDKSSQIELLQADLKKTEENFNQLLESTNADIEKLNTTLEDLQTKIASGSEATTNLKAIIDTRDATLVQRDSKIQSLTAELDAEKAHSGKLEESIKNFQAQIQNFKESLQKSTSENGGGTQAVQQEKIALEKEMLRMQEQIKNLQKGENVTDADFQEAFNLLKASLQPLEDANFAIVQKDSRGLVVSLSADFLFKPATVTLDPQVLATLDQIADVLSKYDSKYIEIQGHTDAQHTERMPFVDNWALASARADKVVRHFANNSKIAPKRLKSSSCSQYRPPTDAASKTRKMLRRVDIILTTKP